MTLTTFESAVFDGGAQNSLTVTDEFVFTVCSIPRWVRDWQSQWHHSHRHAQWKNCRHKIYKMRNRRILTAQWMYGHFAVYESLNRCTRARFCCWLEVGSPISAFRFPLCLSIVNFKNTTPSGDIPRDHYRQHCQYRLRGLRYIMRSLASSIIKGNVRRHLVISHASIIDIVNTGYGA